VAGGTRKNWRELCNAALEAKNPDELLEIVQEINNALKPEEQVRRDFREAREGNNSFGAILRLRIENSDRDSLTVQRSGSPTAQVTRGQE